MYEYTLNDIEKHLKEYIDHLADKDQYQNDLDKILPHNQGDKKRLIFIYDACKMALKELGVPKAIPVFDGMENGKLKFTTKEAISSPSIQDLINKTNELLLKSGAKIT